MHGQKTKVEHSNNIRMILLKLNLNFLITFIFILEYYLKVLEI